MLLQYCCMPERIKVLMLGCLFLCSLLTLTILVYSQDRHSKPVAISVEPWAPAQMLDRFGKLSINPTKTHADGLNCV